MENKSTTNIKRHEFLNEDIFRKKIRINVFKKILKENLNANSEKILIAGDKGYENSLAAPILSKAYELASKDLGLNYDTAYQNFKGRGDFADEVMIQKLKSLPKQSIIVMNISNRIGNLDNLGPSFRTFTKQNSHRFVSSSSLGTILNKNIPLVVDCLDINYQEIDKKTEKLKNLMSSAQEINISTKTGTNINYNVSGITAKKATGIYRNPGEGGNLPGSEAYIAPNKDKVEGTIVIDGSVRLKNTTIIPKYPIKLDINRGIITKINENSDAKKLYETLIWAHNKAKNPLGCWKIGELGIGLNKKAKIIGSTIIDEKAYGTAHFAIGSNTWFGGDIKSIIHLDQVIKNPIIKIDGKLLKY